MTQLTQHDDEWRRLRESRELTKSIHIFTERIRNWTYKSFHRTRSRAHNTRISNVNSLSLRRDDVGSVGELILFSLRHKFNALHRRVECCVFFAWNRVSRHRVSICEFSQSAAILLRYLLLHRVQWILAGSDGFALCAIQSLSPSKTRAGSSRAAESIHSWNFKYFTI